MYFGTGLFFHEFVIFGPVPNPFQKLDQIGVGKLVKMAVDLGKATRPDIYLGICGEHGGDPSTIEFCHKVGLTYVSCSSYNLQI